MLSLPSTELRSEAADPLGITNSKLLNQKINQVNANLNKHNLIGGGNFSTNPWQRGTTFVAPATGAYTADRWALFNVSAAVVDITQTADAPTVDQAGVYTQHCLQVNVTTADAAVAAADRIGLFTRVEGLDIAELGFGQTGVRYLTLSFWVKTAVAGTYCVSLANSAGNRAYTTEYVVTSANTWEPKTLTFPVDTAGTWLYDTGIGLSIRFTLMCGTTFQQSLNTWEAGTFLATANQVNSVTTVGNKFRLALVKLEAGTIYTGWQPLAYPTLMNKFYRYYFRDKATGNNYHFGLGRVETAASAFTTINFPVPMRVAPTALEQSGTATDYEVYDVGVVACNAVPTFTTATVKQAIVGFPVAAGLTVGRAVWGRAAVAAGYLGFNAEL